MSFDSRPPVDRLAVAGGGRYLLTHAARWDVWDVQSGAVVTGALVRVVGDIPPAFDPHGTTYIRSGPIGAERRDFLTGQVVADVARWRVPEAVRHAELAADLRRAAVVTVPSEVYIVEADGSRPPTKLTLPEPVRRGVGVRFSPDGNTLAVLYHRLMYLWDVAALKLRAKCLWSDRGAWKLSFHPTAPVFAALNTDGQLTFFGTATGDPVRSFDFAVGKKVRCAAFSPDGLTCAVGGSNKQFAVFDVDV